MHYVKGEGPSGGCVRVGKSKKKCWDQEKGRGTRRKRPPARVGGVYEVIMEGIT